MQYVLPASVDNLKLIEALKEPPENSEDELDHFTELLKFDATEVHVNNIEEEEEEVHHTDDDKKDWSKVLNAITNLENHYLYKLQ